MVVCLAKYFSQGTHVALHSQDTVAYLFTRYMIQLVNEDKDTDVRCPERVWRGFLAQHMEDKSNVGHVAKHLILLYQYTCSAFSTSHSQQPSPRPINNLMYLKNN